MSASLSAGHSGDEVLVGVQHQVVAERDRHAPRLAASWTGRERVGQVGSEIDQRRRRAWIVSDAVNGTDVVGDRPQQLRRLAGEAGRQEVLAELLDVLVDHRDGHVGMGGRVVGRQLLDELEGAVGLAFLGPERECDRVLGKRQGARSR